MNTLPRSLALITTVAAFSFAAKAEVYFSDNFNSYSAGDLVGQGGWTLTGTSVVNPIQASNGGASLTTTGQDLYSPLSSILTPADGTTFYIGLTLNVSAAQATGDYFLHFTPALGETSALYGRLFVKSSGTGYQLGYLETSGTGSATTYGTTDLTFGSSYRVVLAYNRVAGTLNDTANLYVNPSNTAVEGANTPYLTDTWTTATAEPAAIAALNLRQGTAANAPTLALDNLVAASTFAEVAVVPEPATAGLVALGAGALLIRRRRA
jgi:trimeric autotransporter adhesin